MDTKTQFLDLPLQNVPDTQNSLGTEDTLIPVIELRDGEIDPRFTRHSFSSLSLFNGCARKFQLSRLRAKAKTDSNTSVTFAFGHAIGDAIPKVLEGVPLDTIFFEMFLNWDVDFLAENPKQKKSFVAAMQAVRLFVTEREEGELQHYIPHKLDNGKLAAEMSFKIDVKESSFRDTPHTFRGYLDLVLQNVMNGELTVLENKTNSGTWVNHYYYKNSAQSIGYGVILESIHPEDTAYEVLYCIFMTKLERYEIFPFPKSYHQKALWLRDILYSINRIEHLAATEGNYGIWPMNGDRCTDFGRVCEFMDVCHLNTLDLVSRPTEEDLIDRAPNGEVATYDYEFNFMDLLES